MNRACSSNAYPDGFEVEATVICVERLHVEPPTVGDASPASPGVEEIGDECGGVLGLVEKQQMAGAVDQFEA
jgi:hypothetical protein